MESSGLDRLRKPNEGELPDARLPKALRERLKRRAERWAITCTPEELMYLAGALEAEAQKKADR